MGGAVDRPAGLIIQNRPSADVDGLVLRVAQGDRFALKSLYERTAAKLYGICRRVTGDESEAQDVLQEVFVLVWGKASRFDPAKASAITWLATLARNKAVDRVRARRQATAPIEEADQVASDDPSQLDVIESAQDAGRLTRCLEELDERARSMIRTAFFDGATYPELARREGVPLATMKSWIRRGLIRLRGCLEQ
jgi:RNA polymerase sigma-70 factor (ECF subfamily)